MFRNIDIWVKSYIKRQWLIKDLNLRNRATAKNILFTICDHFEPFWQNATIAEANARVAMWVDTYQKIAQEHTDHLGQHPKHCFFYPEEEYNYDIVEMISEICRNGFGEVEVHLHHDNDTPQNLRNTLLTFKKKLSQNHGLLSRKKDGSEISYGFIHGNWALDNSRPDGRWCGVNNEIDILIETGCYADFTMPSAPDITQTSTINSIYYAIDNPQKPKSHDKGVLARSQCSGTDGLLCIQGPLSFNFKLRKYGLLPKIENGCFAYDVPFDSNRVKLWIEQYIHVTGEPDIVFVKLYTHGTQESNLDYFFKKRNLEKLFTEIEDYTNSINANLYYVSARQMYNAVKGIENGQYDSVDDLLNCELEIDY